MGVVESGIRKTMREGRMTRRTNHGKEFGKDIGWFSAVHGISDFKRTMQSLSMECDHWVRFEDMDDSCRQRI